MSNDIISLISFIASIISILVGLFAIFQAKRYNNSSDNINKDTKEMLNIQIRSLEAIQKTIIRNQSYHPNVINISKDEFFIYKLNNFDKKNINLILELFKNIQIKDKTYQYVEVFLKDNSKIRYNLNFSYEAQTKNGQDLEQIENDLFRYGILIKIDYKAQPLKN